jgi:hypothetical protein
MKERKIESEIKRVAEDGLRYCLESSLVGRISFWNPVLSSLNFKEAL